MAMLKAALSCWIPTQRNPVVLALSRWSPPNKPRQPRKVYKARPLRVALSALKRLVVLVPVHLLQANILVLPNVVIGLSSMMNFVTNLTQVISVDPLVVVVVAVATVIATMIAVEDTLLVVTIIVALVTTMTTNDVATEVAVAREMTDTAAVALIAMRVDVKKATVEVAVVAAAAAAVIVVATIVAAKIGTMEPLPATKPLVNTLVVVIILARTDMLAGKETSVWSLVNTVSYTRT
jgi:hypothetical protein